MQETSSSMIAVAATSGLTGLFSAQRVAASRHMDVPLSERSGRLRRIAALWNDNRAALADAVAADFGVRGQRLTQLADGLVLDGLLAELRRKLPLWSEPKRARTPLYLRPGRACIQRQPLGVVGIMSPWNYPLQLTLGPAATALAAGNRVLLKPSEQTPQTAELLATLVARYFEPAELAVVNGGADIAAAFAELPFDHLFFTGSTAVGRKVAQAAARNLTPVTLELGGKSPCIIDRSCSNLDDAARRIAVGKLLNAGQTCIAPDYLLLPRGREEAFSEAYQREISRLYPEVVGNRDYAAMVGPRQYARQLELVEEARAGGARVDDVGPPAMGRPQTDAERRQIRPQLVFDLPAGCRLLEEEIFGPVLPVLTYDALDTVIAYINARARPLALYWFGSDATSRDRVLRETVSGGVTVNDTLMHVAHPALPFGGVGASGMGAWHGEAGFLRFTHQKSVFLQSPAALGGLLDPPYGRRFRRMMALIRHLL
ncbi:MAG: coniferyl aldehyde dehydrogenase [Ottowia sp.]|nr:coniferyl aldehyde dehydrogenase [Ottowia sp.]